MKWLVTVFNDDGEATSTKEFDNEDIAKDYWMNGTEDYQAYIEEVTK